MTDSLVIQRSQQQFTQGRSVIQDMYEHRLPDNNNSRYPGEEIKFNNINSISTYEQPLQISETDTIVPYLVVMESGIDLGPPELIKKAVCLKGNISIVSGSKYVLDNNTLIDYTNNSEILNNFNLLTTMNEQDVKTKGPSMNFAKDTNAFQYDDILGETNTYGGEFGNQGAFTRMTETSNVEKEIDALFKTATYYAKHELSHVTKDGDSTYLFHFYVRIPLKHVNELFARMPLLRGAVQEIYLQIHTATTTVSYDSDGKATSLNLSTTHGSSPYMISDSSLFLPVSIAEVLEVEAVDEVVGVAEVVINGTVTTEEVIAVAAVPYQEYVPAGYTPATIKFSSGIAKVLNKTGQTLNHTKTHCELIAKVYKLDPALEKGFFNSPEQTIPYKKHLVERLIGVAPGRSFNFQVTGNIHKMRDLLVLPILSSTVNGQPSTTLGAPETSLRTFSPLESPFTSCGQTCGPYASVTDYQVLISHQPYYKQPKKLSRDMFDEIKRIGMNGGMDFGFGNQLLSQSDYDSTHGFLYTDLTRANSEIDYISTRSLTITGTNDTPYTMDLICYLGYGARVTIDTSVSKIVIESPQDKDEEDEANHQAMIKAL